MSYLLIIYLGGVAVVATITIFVLRQAFVFNFVSHRAKFIGSAIASLIFGLLGLGLILLLKAL